MHRNLRQLEQYNDDQFVVKGVYKGARSEAILLYLMPGQEMPAHPHKRFEVVLMPLRGWGVLTVDGTKDVELVTETLYYEPEGRTFQITNTGEVPMEVLITLVRVGDSSGDSQQSTEEAAFLEDLAPLDEQVRDMISEGAPTAAAE
jgi:mannose-6-phosphate isomerase-like protein (cupin superfamily)